MRTAWVVLAALVGAFGAARGDEATDPAALRRAIEDLAGTFGPRYPNGPAYLGRLDRLEQALRDAKQAAPLAAARRELAALRREALLANPLLDFPGILLVQRPAQAPQLGLPQNWQSNSSLPAQGFDDAIVRLSWADGKLDSVFKPARGRFVGDVDLHFDADRLLFSMPDDRRRWQVWEVRADGSGLRQLTGQEPDVDCYDACYLPSGQVLFTSTACFQAVPCTGSDDVAVLYRMDGDGKNVRQLTFDQDHDWCPTVLHNGRVLYARWEYTDAVHCHNRRLFHMNPDGTEQMAYLGSNSYWPNATFYARPVPGHPTMIVAVIGGHHGVPRMGELVLFDPARGRHEEQPAVQRIPGFGKRVERVMKDGLADASWPKFLHPYPLSPKHFLVSAKPTPEALWGVYLADVFDNLLLLKEMPGHALFEPVPLRKTPRPPVVPEKADPTRKDAVVTIADIYSGPGLAGIPRGTVKRLRVFSYHYAYRGMVTNPNTIGVNGPWDIKRVLGTVPVQPDGSAHFRIPANTPISIQPLDAEGKALQLMRSWFTGMPGETVSCIGCHEHPNTAPIGRASRAHGLPPAEIEPWRGPPRGFSYRREVQPVLDRHCTSCHDGKPREGRTACDLRGNIDATDYATALSWQRHPHAGRFSEGYMELHRFVRRPGSESDLHMLEPMEYHADTTELVQLLRKGHYGVQLDPEAWDRLITWIDLNCPFHGTRHEELVDPGPQRQRRRELLKKYAAVDDDPEAVSPDAPSYPSASPLPPAARDPSISPLPLAGEGPGVRAVSSSQTSPGKPSPRRHLDLGDHQSIEMALVAAGEVLMGSEAGTADERPACRVRIGRPFWISVGEITNRQYQRFDPAHNSRVESKNATQYGVQGYPVNRPEQPVVRVSWQEAMAFCRWLSAKTGAAASLPTEAQWEYAARAGASGPHFFKGDDFSAFANLADAKLAEFASDVWDNDKPLRDATRYDEWIPKDPRFNDGGLLTVAPGRYRPNAWGLHDVYGNAAEWTRSIYRPYPYDPGDGRDDPSVPGPRVVRGGSWRDRPARATSSFRLAYQPYQRVFNVGFRIVAEDAAEPAR